MRGRAAWRRRGRCLWRRRRRTGAVTNDDNRGGGNTKLNVVGAGSVGATDNNIHNVGGAHAYRTTHDGDNNAGGTGGGYYYCGHD